MYVRSKVNPDFLGFSFTIMCTSSSSSWRAGGRELPGWLRQTLSWDRAVLKLNTPDTSRRLVRNVSKGDGQSATRQRDIYSFEFRQVKCGAHVCLNYSANLKWHVVQALTYFLRHGQSLRVDNGVQLLLLEFFDSVLVVSQVQLGAH